MPPKPLTTVAAPRGGAASSCWCAPKRWKAAGVEFARSRHRPWLAAQVLERLFEAFFSTKSEGMGIGLNLCRSIIESHNGRLQAQNLYNGSEVTGCCFSFWIPLAEPAALQEDKDTLPPNNKEPPYEYDCEKRHRLRCG